MGKDYKAYLHITPMNCRKREGGGGYEIRYQEHVKVRPGVSGRKPRITGHRIRVMDIVLWQTKCGWSPDEIVSQFPQLSLADVHAALAYYWDHKEEIEADIRSAEEIEAKSRRKHPSIASYSSQM